MGEPMATRLVQHVVVVMLADGDVVDAVLGRRADCFEVEVAGRTIVHTGTVSPAYSRSLGDQLAACGGELVEAPVSGSSGPARAGELVGMLAGRPAALDEVEDLLAPRTARTFRCGPVPGALETKLAVNTHLIVMVTGLAEAAAYAELRGVDLVLLREVLAAGPMASPVSRGKLAKLLNGDLSAQAAVSDAGVAVSSGSGSATDGTRRRSCARSSIDTAPGTASSRKPGPTLVGIGITLS